MVKTIPQMYRYLYERAERATEIGPFRAWAHQFAAGNLRSLMQSYAPDAVVCTHAFACGVMAEYKRQFDDAPAVFGVVTDFAIHAFWIHENIDGYAVATPEMKAALVARGVAPARVLVSGIPVRSAFSRADVPREVLRERLDLPRDRACVLLMGGGLGIGPLETMMRSLQELREPIAAVAIVGRSRRLERRVLDCAERMGYPIRVLPFIENVHEYMHAADVLITKPGGLTTSEALVAGIPMVLFAPLPGQEERNTRLLVRSGAARRARSAHDLAACVQRLAVPGENRERMRTAMRALAKPDAASEIAAAIRALAERSNVQAIA